MVILKTKVLNTLIVIIIVFSAFCADVSATEITPKRILVLGDSISTGYGLEGYNSGNAMGYSQRIKKAFNISDENYLNEAVDGYTSKNLLDFIKEAENKDIFSHYDTIFITTGGNDILNRVLSEMQNISDYIPTDLGNDVKSALNSIKTSADKIYTELDKDDVRKGFQQETDQFIKNYNDIIAKLKELCPNANIYVQTIYNPFSGVVGLENVSNYCDTYLEQMNDVIRKTTNINCIDVSQAFKGRGMLYTNILSMDIHPNSQGHYKISTMIYNIIVPPAETQNVNASVKEKKTSKLLDNSLKSSCDYLEKIS